MVKNLDLDSNLNNLKKHIKKASKILKLTRTDPTAEPRKRKKSKKVLTWFLDLLTRLARPGSVEPQFFLAESFSKGSIYLESLKKILKKKTFFNKKKHFFTQNFIHSIIFIF